MDQIISHSSPRRFLDRAEEWLETAEVDNNLIIGVARNTAVADPAVTGDWLTLERDGRLTGAVIRTPPHNPIVTDLPADSMDEVIDHFRDCNPPLGGVFGPAESARQFAEGWARSTNRQARLKIGMVLSDCREVRMSRAVKGNLRQVHSDDVDVLAKWLVAFAHDVGTDPPADDPTASARRIIENGNAWIWDTGDGAASCVCRGRESRRGACVTLVYTPPEQRGRGYAQALVASVTQELLARGKDFCCLFANRDEPVPNHVYRNVGYVPIREFEWWEFPSAPTIT